MRVTLVATAPADIDVDALAIPIAAGQRLSGISLDLDRALGGLLSELLASSEFKGRVLLRSQIADLRNADYGEAGAILGGMFIGEFARGKPWVHLDIAASSWNTNAELTTMLRGPSGAGTRLCIELAELMAGAAR